MVSSKEIGRLVNGLSVVVKEILKRNTQGLANGDVQSVIKKALTSATDLSGLTKGRVREYTIRNNKDSVVYFAEDLSKNGEEESKPTTPNQLSADGTIQGEVVKEVIFDSRGDPTENVAGNGESNNCAQKGGNYQSRKDMPASKANAVADSVVGGEESAALTSTTLPPPSPPPLKSKKKPRERRVPSTPFSRMLGFAGLGAGLAWGTIQESAKRLAFGTPKSKDKQSALSPFLSEKNAERLALALCRMRGAALKLGQMLSIQDESLVPAPILAALDIVRQGADVMPRSQLNQVLDAELGPDWSSKLMSFDYEPMAAASIGQVHRAVTKDGLDVAIKIQYPGVADSIESDIDNVKLLLDYTNLIPERLYLDNAMKVAKEELSRECDYELEAANQRRFRNLLSHTEGFYVPLVVDDISGKRVLTTELVPGIPVDKVALLDQETRNYVGKKLLELTLTELFVFRFMQTDPNWSNFLFDEGTKLINLIDFGAARDYPKHFVDDYLRMVLACANSDREAVIKMSRRLGFLTGMEPEVMVETHVQAGFVVGLPFSSPGGYDFRSTNITTSISNLGATMLRHRLTPPPEEAYSLHRKLSGAFLACIKLGAVVPCREVLLEVHERYPW